MYNKRMTSQKYHLQPDIRKVFNFYPSDSTLYKIQKAKELRLHGMSYGQIANIMSISRPYAFQLVNYEAIRKGGESK